MILASSFDGSTQPSLFHRDSFPQRDYGPGGAKVPHDQRYAPAAMLPSPVRRALLVFGQPFPAGSEHRVITRMAEDVVQLPTAHALVAPVVEREHHGVTH